ncbi:MAG: PorP/SprF family type IX secretion system membrane protein [Saprospiraceae bacterium]
MHSKKLLFLLAALLIGSATWAQDIHYTMYNMSPMTLNPANAGKFEGTARIGGIYRSQWSPISNNPYRTPSVWVDAPILRGFRKQDWIGIGLMLYQDKAGATAISHGAFKLGATYHLALGKSGNTVISIGGHYGGENRKIDNNLVQFGDGFIGPNNYSQAKSMDQGRVLGNANYTDIDAGIVFSTRLNKATDLSLGFSMFHLTKPNYSLLSGGGGSGGPQQGQSELPTRAIATGVFNLALNDRWTISPSFLFQTMAANDEISVQGLAGYLFSPEKDITLRAGVSYRLGDAISPMIGAKIKDLTLGFAYDVNTSPLEVATSNQGGFEIAANYIIKIYKPAVVKPKVLCPRF